MSWARLIFLTLLFAGSLMTGYTGHEILAAGKVKSVGMLTLIEPDGSVLIDDKGYLVDRSVKVFDQEGRKISIKDLVLPVRIEFDFFYTAEGVIIKLIRVIPEDIPR